MINISKTQKITAEELGKLASGNGTVLVIGEKGSDGSYNATNMLVVNIAGFGNGAPPANFTPPTGGAMPPQGRGMGNQGLIVRDGTLSGNKFTGMSFTGEALTVNISNSTNFAQQATGKLEDLKAGLNVLVSVIPAQTGGADELLNIVIS